MTQFTLAWRTSPIFVSFRLHVSRQDANQFDRSPHALRANVDKERGAQNTCSLWDLGRPQGDCYSGSGNGKIDDEETGVIPVYSVGVVEFVRS